MIISRRKKTSNFQSVTTQAPTPEDRVYTATHTSAEQLGLVSRAKRVQCANALLARGEAATFGIRARTAVQAGTAIRLAGVRSNGQRSNPCVASRMTRCDRLPPPPSAATGEVQEHAEGKSVCRKKCEPTPQPERDKRSNCSVKHTTPALYFRMLLL